MFPAVCGRSANRGTTPGGSRHDRRDGYTTHHEVSDATRNDCESCERRVWEYDWHCQRCHADTHNSCAWCGGCMPDNVRTGPYRNMLRPKRHRRTRRYCSTTCRGCGEVLDGKRSDARYCSPACRQRAYRARQQKETAS
jgi:hypothetical protein